MGHRFGKTVIYTNKGVKKPKIDTYFKILNSVLE